MSDPQDPYLQLAQQVVQQVHGNYDTALPPDEEASFQTWKTQYAPNDSGQDYDLRGAYKAGLKPDPQTGHWPDTFKKPNHPTFSNESIYAKLAPERAGSWKGDQYVPPQPSDENDPYLKLATEVTQAAKPGVMDYVTGLPKAVAHGFVSTIGEGIAGAGALGAQFTSNEAHTAFEKLQHAGEFVTGKAPDVNPQVAESLPGKIASGIGSTGAFVATALIPGVGEEMAGEGILAKLGISALKMAPTAVAGGLVESGTAYHQAIAEGATQEDAIKAAILSFPGGASIALPVAPWGNRFLKAMGGVERMSGGLFGHALLEGGALGVQQSFQGAWGEAVSQYLKIHPDDQSAIYDAATSNFLPAFLTGGLISGLVSHVAGRHQEAALEEPPEGMTNVPRGTSANPEFQGPPEHDFGTLSSKEQALADKFAQANGFDRAWVPTQGVEEGQEQEESPVGVPVVGVAPERVQRLAGRYGARVLTLEAPHGVRLDEADGVYDEHTIIVDAKLPEDVMVRKVLGHELFHRLTAEAPEEAASLRDTLEQFFPERVESAQRKADAHEPAVRNEERGAYLSEYPALALADLIEKPNEMAKALAARPSLGRALLDTLRKMLRLVGVKTGATYAEQQAALERSYGPGNELRAAIAMRDALAAIEADQYRQPDNSVRQAVAGLLPALRGSSESVGEESTRNTKEAQRQRRTAPKPGEGAIHLPSDLHEHGIDMRTLPEQTPGEFTPPESYSPHDLVKGLLPQKGTESVEEESARATREAKEQRVGYKPTIQLPESISRGTEPGEFQQLYVGDKVKVNGREGKVVEATGSGIRQRALVAYPEGDYAPVTMRKGNVEIVEQKRGAQLKLTEKEKARRAKATKERTEGAEPRFSKAAKEDSEEFKKWFGKSEVVDKETGKPLVVFHGTTNDFTEFDPKKANVENMLGQGLYFTSDTDDANHNYASRSGPDLRLKIEMRAEELFGDPDSGISTYEEARDLANKELTRHEGAVLPVYLKIERPFVLALRRPTFLDYQNGRGLLARFVNAVRTVSKQFNADPTEALGPIMQEADDGMTSNQLLHAMRGSSFWFETQDDAGKIAGPEIFRRALESVGFDGVVDRLVADRFKGMEDIDASTTHYIAFRPSQVKSAIGNRGTFESRNKDIRFSKAFPERRLDELGFYSRLEELARALPEKISAQSALAKLKAQGHPEEMQFSGLTKWLTDKKAEKLTRDEIVQFLVDNNVKLKERVYPRVEERVVPIDLEERYRQAARVTNDPDWQRFYDEHPQWEDHNFEFDETAFDNDFEFHGEDIEADPNESSSASEGEEHTLEDFKESGAIDIPDEVLALFDAERLQPADVPGQTHLFADAPGIGRTAEDLHVKVVELNDDFGNTYHVVGNDTVGWVPLDEDGKVFKWRGRQSQDYGPGREFENWEAAHTHHLKTRKIALYDTLEDAKEPIDEDIREGPWQEAYDEAYNEAYNEAEQQARSQAREEAESDERNRWEDEREEAFNDWLGDNPADADEEPTQAQLAQGEQQLALTEGGQQQALVPAAPTTRIERVTIPHKWERYTEPGGADYGERTLAWANAPKEVQVGSHAFSEKNVIVWARHKMRDVLDPKGGGKAFFNEENQSDFHDAPRTALASEMERRKAAGETPFTQAEQRVYGYKKSPEEALRLELLAKTASDRTGEALDRATADLARVGVDLTTHGTGAQRRTVLRHLSEDEGVAVLGKDLTDEQLFQARQSYIEVSAASAVSEAAWGEHNAAIRGTADAPFKGVDWERLAIARQLYLAAQTGADWFSWTTGKMQNERYPGGTVPGGMEAAYDKREPDMVKKLVKEKGGEPKVEMIQLSATHEKLLPNEDGTPDFISKPLKSHTPAVRLTPEVRARIIDEGFSRFSKRHKGEEEEFGQPHYATSVEGERTVGARMGLEPETIPYVSNDETEQRAKALLAEKGGKTRIERTLAGGYAVSLQEQAAFTVAAEEHLNNLVGGMLRTGNADKAAKVGLGYYALRNEQGRALQAVRRPIGMRDRLYEMIRMPTKSGRDEITKLTKKLRSARTTAQKAAIRAQIKKIQEREARFSKKGVDALNKAGLNPERYSDAQLEAQPFLSQRMARVFNAARSNAWDWVMEYRVSGMISAPVTFAVNAASNTVNLAYKGAVERTVEAMINTVARREGNATLGELPVYFSSLISGLPHAFSNFAHALKEETPVFEAELENKGLIEQGGRTKETLEGRTAGGKIPGYLGRFVRLPGTTAMMAADEFFKTLAGHSEAHALAYRRAGGDMQEMQRLLKDPTTHLWEDALEFAREATFQEVPEGGGLAGVLYKARAWADEQGGKWAFGAPLGSIVLPFVKTPTNIFKQALRIPAAPLILAKDAIKGAGGDVLVRDAAESLITLGAALWLVNWAGKRDKDGIPTITGSAPIDAGGRALAARVAPQFSFRSGNEWVSYARMEPFATAFGLLVDAAQKGDVTEVAKGMYSQATNKTFLASLGDVARALENPDSGAAARVFSSIVLSPMIPNYVQSAVRASKPEVEANVIRPHDDAGAWAAVPQDFVQRAGFAAPPLRYDLYGRPIERNGRSGIARLVDPMQVTGDERTRIKADVAISNWNDNLPPDAHPFYPRPPDYWYEEGGKKRYFSDEEYAELTKRSGELATKLLARMRFNEHAPTQKQIDAISEAFAKARARARAEMKKEHKVGATK